MSFDDGNDVFFYNCRDDSGYAEDASSIAQDIFLDAHSDDTGAEHSLSKKTYIHTASSGSGVGYPDFDLGLSPLSRSRSAEQATIEASSHNCLDHADRFPNVRQLTSASGYHLAVHTPCSSDFSGQTLPTSLDYSPRSLRSLGQHRDPSRPQFLSQIRSFGPALTQSQHICVQESLLDVVDGQLFEDSDPWKALQSRLGVQLAGSSLVDDDQKRSLSPELRGTTDRRGVGYIDEHSQHVDTQSCVLMPISRILSASPPASLHREETPFCSQPHVSNTETAAGFALPSSSSSNVQLNEQQPPLPCDAASRTIDAFGGEELGLSEVPTRAPIITAPDACSSPQTTLPSCPASIPDEMFRASPSTFRNTTLGPPQPPLPVNRNPCDAEPVGSGEDPPFVVRSQGENLIVGPSLFFDEDSEEE